ncbi:Alkyldihydroxyacetonephosphate synthase [Candidatus Phaeomarinobacter ectocarpi]|uniref:Alkyldihydroxyacetonephosphate synthase n=1 Tax=Candidatus Phaeomarinibacter ectocarpi TaxID=1458461 RepID=X5MEH2_9HYPH|nr:FAD-binding oxidoreductase [Candidatus Phaeomarinobacter ectocarpi]CDO59204.1 Alkyldihydroxyacetonephosphate synthase [Candidatus Phaeomarinobacter ectocarpi]
MTIDRTSLRWNGWGPTAQPDALPDGSPAWDWIADALGISSPLPKTPAKDLSDCTVPASGLDGETRLELERIVGANQVHVGDYERAFHARGKSYHDLLWMRAGNISNAPDAVVYPRSEEEVQRLVEFAAASDIVLVPYGGGSSVVGGVTAREEGETRLCITVDTTLMASLLSIDETAMTATAQAGIYGPALDTALSNHGVRLGHYPQSFEYSTLGGWVAARGAGQNSIRYGRADKWLVSAHVATPSGLWRTEATPGSAAAPNLNQLVAGSEGTLGIITQATFKIHDVPETEDYRGYLFRSFAEGADAIRQIVQAEIPTAMLRLSDPDETYFFRTLSSVGKEKGIKDNLADAYLRLRGYADKPCVLLIGMEGSAVNVSYARDRAARIIAATGGLHAGKSPGTSWKAGRFHGPMVRDPMMDHGLGVDTLETSTFWSNIETLHKAVTDAIATSTKETLDGPGQQGIVMAHISHAYADGASLYFTFVFPRRHDGGLEGEIEQWLTIKRAASDAIAANGGTISHHHGVGTDHAPWLGQEKGPIGMQTLSAVKNSIDPKGVMNPRKVLG